MGHIIKDRNGFSLVEAIIATALVGLFLSACSLGLSYGVRSTKEAGRKQQAIYFAEEGLAAVQNIRDAAYTNLTDGTWGLTTAGNQWDLSGASDVNGLFTRAVTIASFGATAKQVTSSVTWNDTSTKAQTISLTTYLSDWLSAATSPWTGALFAGSIDLSGNQNLLKIYSVGNYAYAVRDVSGSANFFIFDVSVSAAPTTVGSITLNNTPSNIVVLGGYAYVSSSDNSQELQIVNISTPSAPVLAGSYNASGNANANGIAISGTTAYLVRSQGSDKEFLAINVATPSAPTLTGSLDLSDNANEIAISGNYAYIASSINSQELQVINIATPSAPVLLGGYDLGGSNANANTVAVSGTTVYLGISSTLYVLNDSVHGTPTLYGSTALSGTVNDISVGSGSMSYLFVGTSYASNEFRIVDASTPTTPVVLMAVNLASDANGVAYNSDLDIAVIADTSNAGELMIVSHP